MIWDMRDCLAIRARLAAEDFDFDAFDAEVIKRIEAAGRTFNFAHATGLEVLS